MQCRSKTSSSTPTRSTNWWSVRCRRRHCSRRDFASARRGPCCCRGAGPIDERRLWQQRQRAADLLAVASKYPTFPILLETSRECLQDVFDLPGLREVLGQLRSRTVRVVSVDTAKASPFAQSLLFNWIAAYMYEGDAPLAERRAAALSLDRDLLRDLLGAEELRELLDPGVLADVELELQCVADGRRARSADELHDVLRKVGDLTAAEIDLRCEGSCDRVDRRAHPNRRAIEIQLGGEARFIAADDAARYRDAFGCNIPLGLPLAFTEPVPHPLESLVARYARTHGPFTPTDVARRFASPLDRIVGALTALEAEDRVVHGEFRRVASVASTAMSMSCDSCGVDRWRCCGARSNRSNRRPMPASSRHGTASPASDAGSIRWSRRWRSCRARHWWPRRWRTNCCRRDCAATAPPISMSCARPAMWSGSVAVRSVPATAGYVCTSRISSPRSMHRSRRPSPPDGPLHDAIRAHLGSHGASFWNQLRAASADATDVELLAALWDLVWAGEVTNDSLAPLRAMLSGGTRSRSSATPRVLGRARVGSTESVRRQAQVDGRWSLRCGCPLLRPPRQRMRPRCSLLERYGVVTREAVLAEGVKGGYAAAYAVLKVLEERGHVRRGYFVAGLGAAQFALPGAVDRLRSAREVPDAMLHPELVARGGGAVVHRSGAAVRRGAGLA